MGYQLIETIEVGSGGAASIEFTGIPQDGVDLVCLISERHTDTGNVIKVALNGDGGSNYTWKRLYGTGSGAYSDGYTSFPPFGPWGAPNSFTANTFGNAEVRIPNYASTNPKVVSYDGVTENNASLAYSGIGVLSWNQSSAITSLTLGTNFAEFSTASLYKITAD